MFGSLESKFLKSRHFELPRMACYKALKTPICEGMQLSNEGFASLFVVSSFTGHMEGFNQLPYV